MPKSTYTVTSPIMHGRRFEIGDAITLSDEDANRLSGYVDLGSKREADPTAVPGAAKASEAGDLLARIAELEAELQQHQESLATLLDDHEKVFADYKQQITDLKAENAQLKAAAKPAAKGK